MEKSVLARDPGQAGKAGGQFLVGGDGVGHDFGSFLCAVRDQNKKAFVPQGMCKKYPLGQKPCDFCGATQIDEGMPRPLYRCANTHRSL